MAATVGAFNAVKLGSNAWETIPISPWLGFRVQGVGFGLKGLGFRILGSGFRVWGLGFWA